MTPAVGVGQTACPSVPTYTPDAGQAETYQLRHDLAAVCAHVDALQDEAGAVVAEASNSLHADVWFVVGIAFGLWAGNWFVRMILP